MKHLKKLGFLFAVIFLGQVFGLFSIPLIFVGIIIFNYIKINVLKTPRTNVVNQGEVQ